MQILAKVKTQSQATFDDLLSLVKLRRNELEYSLNLLVENCLIEERIIFGNKIVYSLSGRGERVLNYFGVNNFFPQTSNV